MEQTKNYYITDACGCCSMCVMVCPADCIDVGVPYAIRQADCLHCGSCMDECPSGAIILQDAEK